MTDLGYAAGFLTRAILALAFLAAAAYVVRLAWIGAGRRGPRSSPIQTPTADRPEFWVDWTTVHHGFEPGKHNGECRMCGLQENTELHYDTNGARLIRGQKFRPKP